MTSFLLTSLNLILLYRGTLTSNPGYSISVPDKVFVEINHCIDVPCTFTVPDWYSKSSKPLYIYWFKNIYKRYYLRWIDMWVLGDLMVTNDLRQRSDVTDFKLIGDPQNGSCSFSIANAKPVDSGKYYLRVDKGEGYSHAFQSSNTQPLVNLQVVLTDVKKPVIWKPLSITWGEPIHFSCVASNCCLKPKPQILWSSKSSHWNIYDWAVQKSNWTWTCGTNLSFVPVLANEGLVLSCNVKYPDAKKSRQNAVQLHMTYGPQPKDIHICQYDRNSTTVCSCAFHSWPPPEIQWYMNHQYLTKETISDDVRIITSTEGNTRTSSLYLFGNIVNSHIITCRGINPIGFSNLETLSMAAKKVKIQQTAQLAEILLVTLISVLILVAVLYYFSGSTKSKVNKAT